MPVEKTTYLCSKCKVEFQNRAQCEDHEAKHLEPIDVKYEYHTDDLQPSAVRAFFADGTNELYVVYDPREDDS